LKSKRTIDGIDDSSFFAMITLVDYYLQYQTDCDKEFVQCLITDYEPEHYEG
jgi:hypothetical protein